MLSIDFGNRVHLYGITNWHGINFNKYKYKLKTHHASNNKFADKLKFK